MPTYEYRCPAGHDFEKFYRKISDAGAEVPCPQCGAIAERKISAGAGLVFKGSGFYITDYGKDGKKDQAAARAKSRPESGGDGASAGSADGASGGDAKGATDAKPAATDAKPAAAKESGKESAKKEPAKSDAAPAKPAKPSTE
jgi:putative FmdB family regulatory protein